jgi:hypothetical protein
MVQRLRDKLLITGKSARNPGKPTSLPTGALHLIVTAPFIVTGRLAQCFFSFPSSFRNCWDKRELRQIKNSQTGQE